MADNELQLTVVITTKGGKRHVWIERAINDVSIGVWETTYPVETKFGNARYDTMAHVWDWVRHTTRNFAI